MQMEGGSAAQGVGAGFSAEEDHPQVALRRSAVMGTEQGVEAGGAVHGVDDSACRIWL